MWYLYLSILSYFRFLHAKFWGWRMYYMYIYVFKLNQTADFLHANFLKWRMYITNFMYIFWLTQCYCTFVIEILPHLLKGPYIKTYFFYRFLPHFLVEDTLLHWWDYFLSTLDFCTMMCFQSRLMCLGRHGFP